MTLRLNQILQTKHDTEVGIDATPWFFPQHLTMPISSGFLHNLTICR